MQCSIFSIQHSVFGIRVIGYSVFGIQFSVFNRVVVFDPLRVVAVAAAVAAAVVVFPFCCSFITKFV